MAEAKVMSALARYAQAKSALFPSLSIGGSFGLSGSIMGQLGEWGTHNSNGFGSLTLPIFNAGSLMAQVEQRRQLKPKLTMKRVCSRAFRM